jgi:hypothetical protein
VQGNWFFMKFISSDDALRVYATLQITTTTKTKIAAAAAATERRTRRIVTPCSVQVDGQIIDSGTQVHSSDAHRYCFSHTLSQHCCMIGVRQGLLNFSVGDSVGKDRDPSAAELFLNSAAVNRPAGPFPIHTS